MFCFYFSFLHLQCPQIFLLLRRDSVALDGLLDGLVVRPESKVELLDVGIVWSHCLARAVAKNQAIHPYIA